LVQALSLDGLEPPWVQPAPPSFFLKKERWLAVLFLSFLSPFEDQGTNLWNSLIYITVVCIPHKNSGLQLCYLLVIIVITCILWTRFLTQVIIPSFFSCLICKSSVHGSWFGWSQTHNMNCCGTIPCVLILAGGTAVWELIARSLKGALTPAQQQVFLFPLLFLTWSQRSYTNPREDEAENPDELWRHFMLIVPWVDIAL
jgi:hypothetical protein